MHCPVCKTIPLTMAERSGIEIDYCPQCRGVWLDRGELDKLIERAAAAAPSPVASPARRPDFVDSDYGRHGSHGSHGHPGGPRRKSWLSDFFD